MLSKFTAGRVVSSDATLEGLGLSSLERVELMVALEDKFQTRIDEGAFSEARDLSDLRALVDRAEPVVLRRRFDEVREEEDEASGRQRTSVLCEVRER